MVPNIVLILSVVYFPAPMKTQEKLNNDNYRSSASKILEWATETI